MQTAETLHEPQHAHQPSGTSPLVIAWMISAFVLPLPWAVMYLTGTHPDAVLQATLSGLAILGAAFILSWAAEVAQLDISQALALALLALIAILPEYAVDAYFAWQAAHDPVYAGYALANMTGANRLLIGIGWSAVILIAVLRMRRHGSQERTVAPEGGAGLEVAILGIATLYALILPFKGEIGLIDTVLFGALFVFYLIASARQPASEPHLVGPAELIARAPTLWRRLTVLGITAFAGLMIFISAEPFAEGLIHVGEGFGIDEFLLVQWLAPLASESPEFLVAGLFAWRMMGAAGLQALVSSKVNQWTLLVGMLPLITSISAGAFSSLPLDGRQAHEVWLTAAQSLFAVVLLLRGRLGLKEAAALAILFLAQLFWPFGEGWLIFSAIYITLSVGILIISPEHRNGGIRLFRSLRPGAAATA